jgi:hypothetical protein
VNAVFNLAPFFHRRQTSAGGPTQFVVLFLGGGPFLEKITRRASGLYELTM